MSAVRATWQIKCWPLDRRASEEFGRLAIVLSGEWTEESHHLFTLHSSFTASSP
jgi:hypothetical protein